MRGVETGLEIVDLLRSVRMTVANEPSLAVKGFGILLLGKTFEENLPDKAPMDPTELILFGGGPEVPNL